MYYKGRRLISDEVEAASILKSPQSSPSLRVRASGVLSGRSHQLYSSRGRIIVDELEAMEIMKKAYSSSARELVGLAREHRKTTQLLQGGQRSTMRDFGQLIYRAGKMDLSTRMQGSLIKSGNPGLRELPYESGGGFVAFETEKRISKSAMKKWQKRGKREPKPQPQVLKTGRDLEFHPPGGRHNPGNIEDLRGSYIRPATQPGQRKNRERSTSLGPRDLDESEKF